MRNAGLVCLTVVIGVSLPGVAFARAGCERDTAALSPTPCDAGADCHGVSRGRGFEVEGPEDAAADETNTGDAGRDGEPPDARIIGATQRLPPWELRWERASDGGPALEGVASQWSRHVRTLAPPREGPGDEGVLDDQVPPVVGDAAIDFDDQGMVDSVADAGFNCQCGVARRGPSLPVAAVAVLLSLFALRRRPFARRGGAFASGTGANPDSD